MHRFFADAQGITDGVVCLEENDARHALRVLRLEKGELCVVMSDGARYAAQIEEIEDETVRCRILEPMDTTESELAVTLYQGLPKQEKMELVVQKLTELGGARVVPVAMGRCVVQLNAKDGAKKQERWQKIAREAAKQSGRALVPEVEAPISMKELLERLPKHEAALIPWEDASGRSLRSFHEERPEVRDVALVIGPEGGMSSEEVALMSDVGALPVTLGPRILRTETAGMTALAVLLALYGEME